MRSRFLLAIALCAAGIALGASPSQARTVLVSDLSVDPGQTGALVSVSVDSAGGIAGGDITLSYNADVLTAREVRPGSLLSPAGITLVSNISAAGQVIVSMAGARGIVSGSGALVTVAFDVKASAPPGTYGLELRGTLRDENGRALSSTLKKGVLTVKDPAGTGAGGGGGRTVLVSDLSVEAGQTGALVSVSVDSAGGIAGGDITLSYNADVLTAREVRPGSLLSPAGITLVSNLSAAGQVIVSMAGARGIVSGNGALVAVVFDVKASAPPGTYGLELRGTLRDENGKALPAILKKGVLTLNAAPSGPLTPKEGDGSGTLDLNLTAGDQKALTLNGVKPGQKVEVQVLLNKEFANATAFQVILKFDPKKLSLAAVTGRKDGPSFASALDLPAQARGDSVVYGASFLGGTTTATRGAVAVLTFETTGDFSGDTEISLSSLSIRVAGVFTAFRPGASLVLSSQAGGPPSPDFSGDGEVGFDDFFLFASAFGQPAIGVSVKFDLDEDGEIGFGDFFLFASAFGKTTK
ncbi:MAG: hypothetical protein EXS64_18065 [Candidatus Latescibacteria bacterium]|nr:hypothetical protein [Candidatus Latescibacterota bacterium]